MSDKITITQEERTDLFRVVLNLTKAIVELGAYTSRKLPEISEQSDDICKYASSATFITAQILNIPAIDALKLTKEYYYKDEKVSGLTIDDFIKGDG